jgi:hypothetical protein
MSRNIFLRNIHFEELFSWEFLRSHLEEFDCIYNLDPRYLYGHQIL